MKLLIKLTISFFIISLLVTSCLAENIQCGLKTEKNIYNIVSALKENNSLSQQLSNVNEFYTDQNDIYNRSWYNVSDLQYFGQTAWGCTTNDFNNDGNIDFAVSSATSPFVYSTISIFYNDGKAHFTKVDVFTFHEYINDLDSGDYDKDGDIDFIFTYDEQNGSINVYGITSLLYNNGDNTFINVSIIARRGSGIPYDPEGRINPAVTTADFDNDGDLDLLVGDNSGKVEFYLNNGAGNFTSEGIIYDFGDLSWGLTLADIDHDNHIDFFVSNMNGTIFLKRNNGLPSCFDHDSGEILYDFNTSYGACSIQSFDFDDDGKIEFLVGLFDNLYLLHNYSRKWDRLYLGQLPDSPEGYGDDLSVGDIVIGDFNKDNRTDFITGGVQGVVRLFLRKPGPWVFISRPKNGLDYTFDKETVPSLPPVFIGVVGKLTITVLGSKNITHVAFYIDNKLKKIDRQPPFSWTWVLGRPYLVHDPDIKIKTIGYTASDGYCQDQIRIEKTSVLLYFLIQIIS